MENTQRKTDEEKDRDLRHGYKIFGPGGPTFTNYRLVTVCLGLLNAALFTAALVIGINCARVKEGSIHVTHSAATQLTSELDYLLSNHSDVIKAEEEANRTLENARKNHAQLQMKIEQQKTINEGYRRQVEALQKEKTSLQANVSSLDGTCGRCPLGWIPLNSSCYFFSPSAVKKTWSDSRADCTDRGSDLVVIDNQEEQKFVSVIIENKSRERNVWSFWIGLTDSVTEGEWVWINNVTEVEQRFWKDGEPNDMGDGEDCAFAVASPSNPWKTRNDAPCSQQAHWICEQPSS